MINTAASVEAAVPFRVMLGAKCGCFSKVVCEFLHFRLVYCTTKRRLGGGFRIGWTFYPQYLDLLSVRYCLAVIPVVFLNTREK